MSETGKTLLEDIESLLEKEGLLQRTACSECGKDSLSCCQFNGHFVSGNFCSDCLASMKSMEEMLDSREKMLQLHVRLKPGCHFVFLTPDELWLVKPGVVMEQFPYVDPTSIPSERLVQNLSTYLIFS